LKRSPLQRWKWFFLVFDNFPVGGDARRLLSREFKPEQIQKHAVVYFGLGVSGEDQALPSVVGK
jgi:hypothetical protein